MTRRGHLPPQFLEGAFRVSDALADGVSRSRLRASDLTTPAHGLRALAKSSTAASLDDAQKNAERDVRKELLARVRLVAPALRSGEFVSHETALAVMGAPLPSLPYEPGIHFSAHRPIGKPRRGGIVGHRLQARATAARLVDEVLCEAPARAWRQTGRLWTLDDLVAAADYLVCPRNRLATIDDLRAEVDAMGDVARAKLAAALDLVRIGAESPQETRLRLALHRAGLPEPDLNWQLYTAQGDEIARLDLAYPRYRVAAEYDGRIHAEDVEQFRRDADRWDAIRAEGWQLVRVLNHHMRPNSHVAVKKVADALVAAGWRPGMR